MKEQLIVAIGREFGSGGHEIARQLAARLNLPLYDQNMLQVIAAERMADIKALEVYDEQPRKRIVSRRLKGFSNAPEDAVAQMEFDYMKEQAQNGNSFVVLGRCAEAVLEEYPGLISIFVRADVNFKKERTMAREAITEEEARALMNRTDSQRRAYHDQFCIHPWGGAETYDLLIDSSHLGIEGTVEVLDYYIQKRRDA